jgi:hypothetical protein
MSPEKIIAVVGVIIIIITFVVILFRKAPKRVRRHKYTTKWRDIQHLCAEQSNWPQAIMLSDLLLDDVLKRRKRDGKTMGERLVSAQKDFADNDSVWQAHKYANSVRENKKVLNEIDVKKTLISFRQALRDLGAL